ncbi:hypothetical protein B9Z19DRAFT_1123022 [Tuber borchii]|uniref:Uncharacterized protein n=1 Tax=Tuber borchii TaxID=42251 RepID=A0A2T6ZZ79_TUBBO|nr:hypothetical protein B9Z19DRAFT_1123022 [Tuber borchii]
MGNIIARAVTRPDIHPNLIADFHTQIDAIAEKLAANLAQFRAHAEQINLRIAKYESQVAKDNHHHQTMLEARMTLRALRKKAGRLENATKKRGIPRISGRGLPEKKFIKDKRRRRIGPGRIVRCSERASGGSRVPARRSHRF